MCRVSECAEFAKKHGVGGKKFLTMYEVFSTVLQTLQEATSSTLIAIREYDTFHAEFCEDLQILSPESHSVQANSGLFQEYLLMNALMALSRPLGSHSFGSVLFVVTTR
jgi:hypothetical protein